MKSIIFATAALLAVAGVVHAQPLRGAAMFERLDADNDGKITKAEMSAGRERMFKRLDRNGDGVIDENEIEKARQAIEDRAAGAEARLSGQWRRMDRDRDGKVSVAEFQARSAMFELADRNSDGVVTKDEIDFMRDLSGRAG
jgi:Ca2+-binding EF-hand superfamily protein